MMVCLLILTEISFMFLLDCKYIKLYIQEYKNEINAILGRILAFLKDWRNAISFIIAWIITNGWGWAFLILGPILKIRWMEIVGSAYIGFLWLPVVNEKVVTIALAVVIKKLIFRKRA